MDNTETSSAMASFSALLKEQIYIIGNSRQPSVTQVLCLTQQTNAQERLSTIGLLELLTNILTNEKEQKGERSDQNRRATRAREREKPNGLACSGAQQNPAQVHYGAWQRTGRIRLRQMQTGIRALH
jgi:hypothetical protein